MQESISNKKIKIPKNIKVSLNNLNNVISISDLNNKSEIEVNSNIKIYIDPGFIIISYKKKEFKKYLGLYNTLIKSHLKGISQKFKVNIFLNGLGFKAKLDQCKDNLVFRLGYSHDIILNIPENIEVSILKPTQITLHGADWGKLTQFAHSIKKLKKVEPYKGKGILLKNETVLRKEGKKNKK